MKLLFLFFLISIFPFSNDPILGSQLEGKASYYGPKFHGKTTANGEKMDKYALTCAHKTLPFGTMIEVENPRNNTRVVVRVNDRGPYSGNRILDVSLAAAEKLDMTRKGVINIKATVVGRDGEVFISRPSPMEMIFSDNEPLPLIENKADKSLLEKKRQERKKE
jgi:rare lipoprotein A